MEAERGETVVTPEGCIGVIDEDLGNGNVGVEVMGSSVVRGFDANELIKMASSLRVLVEHPADVNSLLDRAKDAGWMEEKSSTSHIDPPTVHVWFVPSEMKFYRKWHEESIDLTYPSDSDQIIGWLDFHAEDECETCLGAGIIFKKKRVGGEVIMMEKTCPDCSEDDDQYWSPEPSKFIEYSYFTMGQSHRHDLPGLPVIDRNTVVKIISTDPEMSPRDVAFELFDDVWSREFSDRPDMDYYPGGIVRIDYQSWKDNHGDEFKTSEGGD